MGCHLWVRTELDTTERLNFHTVKGFGVVNKAEIDVFLELSCFFYGPTDVGSLIGLFKASLYMWNFSLHMLLKPSLKDFEHYLASM